MQSLWRSETRVFLLAFLPVIFLLGACTAPPPAAPPTAAPTVTPTATHTRTATLPPPTPAPSATPLPTLTPIPALAVCSPLEGYTLADLDDMVVNPYHPPAAGLDDPHHGVDLAVRQEGSQVALAGETVWAALDGTVAAVILDRFPYGYAVLVETPLEAAPPGWVAQAGIPTAAPTLAPRSALTCPPFQTMPEWDASRRSLYVLYAHLLEAPGVQPGQPITCGQPLGKIGSSGNALNPHLHFEVRVGPAGARLGSLAHYDASATEQEMAVYCLWRVSGLFQLVDPMPVLRGTP